MERAAGILMSLTSLPSPYGIGTMGKEARLFADFLHAAGQKVWQLLPVGPTSYGDSPYQPFSTYAGNPYLIDLDTLIDEGLLTKKDVAACYWGDDAGKVDYATVYWYRFGVLRTAFKNFCAGDLHKSAAFRDFCRKNAFWLKDYALYMSVKSGFDMVAWNEWPDEAIRNREAAAIEKYTRKYANDIRFWKFVQYKFFEQWQALREYVNSKGIKLLGDMPIYVAMDSADTWANPDVFWLDEELQPVCVAGCPPDYFSADGQLWGNPLYDWEYLKSTDYEWWFARIASAEKLFDLTRIDHFRAFDTYYAIPFPAENARLGQWMEGPGIDFFIKMKQTLGDVPIVAEDLGELFDSVKTLLKQTGYPGMKVLQFAFDSGEQNDHLPHHFVQNSVVYTGTHDNDTIMGWHDSAKEYDINHAQSYCNRKPDETFCEMLIRTAFASVADLAVIQLQDWLELGHEARMNTPNTLGDNWDWRVEKKQLTKKLAVKIKRLTKDNNR